MKNLPKISVVVPSYNQGNFLEGTLTSILNQHYPNLELLVMDGGSTDNSVEIIKKYESYISYWVSERDGGQTQALISGFGKSTGDIQCWINSDDQMHGQSLFEVADFFRRNPNARAVYGDTIWIDRDGRFLRTQREIPFCLFIWLHTYNYIPGMSMYWRRSLFEEVGGLDPSFELAMDADLWSRFAQVTKIHHRRRIWSKMRYYPEQKNRRLREQSNAEDRIIRSRHWTTDKPSLLRLRRSLAQAMRIMCRLCVGGYSLKYRRNMK